MSKSKSPRSPSSKRKQKLAAEQRDAAIQTRVRGLYYPTGIAPEDMFTDLGRLRKEAEAEVERLIDLIDSLDDADIEPDADFEPTLGSMSSHSEDRSQEDWCTRDVDEREAHTGDDEPSLGIVGNNLDLEEEFDGREDDNTAEPSLGATEVVDQQVAWAGSTAVTWEPEGCASEL